MLLDEEAAQFIDHEADHDKDAGVAQPDQNVP